MAKIKKQTPKHGFIVPPSVAIKISDYIKTAGKNQITTEESLRRAYFNMMIFKGRMDKNWDLIYTEYTIEYFNRDMFYLYKAGIVVDLRELKALSKYLKNHKNNFSLSMITKN